MAENPLKKFFRQPKVFVTLPSGGIFNKPGSLSGSPENMPVYGMTGMDEIIIKTPDALLSGESTVRVVQSCCPNIVDGWDINNLDIDAILVAIRIATYGNTMPVVHVCSNCKTDNNYDINLSTYLEHFTQCSFDSDVVVGDLKIKIKPLTYKQATEFNLENFALQKRLNQIVELTTGDERTTLMTDIFNELGLLQNKITVSSIQQVETPTGVVTEYSFIKEWLDNCDKTIFDAIKETINKNSDAWRVPDQKIKCDSCGHEDAIAVELDQANFFAGA
jgi:hypothetical protein